MSTRNRSEKRCFLISRYDLINTVLLFSLKKAGNVKRCVFIL